jgi:hypothetical protein
MMVKISKSNIAIKKKRITTTVVNPALEEKYINIPAKKIKPIPGSHTSGKIVLDSRLMQLPKNIRVTVHKPQPRQIDEITNLKVPLNLKPTQPKPVPSSPPAISEAPNSFAENVFGESYDDPLQPDQIGENDFNLCNMSAEQYETDLENPEDLIVLPTKNKSEPVLTDPGKKIIEFILYSTN